jgi:hypothetical protein
MNQNKPGIKWRESTDSDVIQAATVDKNRYPLDVQAIIEEEVQRRGLASAIDKEMSSIKRRAEEKAKKGINTKMASVLSSLINRHALICTAVTIIGIASVIILERALSLYRMEVLIALLGLGIIVTLLSERMLQIGNLTLTTGGTVLLMILWRQYAFSLGYVLAGLFLLFITAYRISK